MKRLVFTEKSLEDFDLILEYISTDLANPSAAVQIGNGLMEACELIGKYPELGIRKGAVNSSLRMLTYRGYVIYYRNVEHQVDVLRFLHHSLDHRQKSLE